jgi:NADH:ubiquinone oxidoreductase subunit 5 (subunit L)/multisubunit Na+/H+ antiporter MnhA subunit
MSNAETTFWVMVTRPLLVLVVVFLAALVAYLFRKHWPEGRIKHHFLVVLPEDRRNQRLRKEAAKRERDLAAYDRGSYYGRRVREFLSSRERQ